MLDPWKLDLQTQWSRLVANQTGLLIPDVSTLSTKLYRQISTIFDTWLHFPHNWCPEFRPIPFLVPFLNFPKLVLEFIRFIRFLATASFQKHQWLIGVDLTSFALQRTFCRENVLQSGFQLKRETKKRNLLLPDCEVSHESWISLALWQERHLSWSISALIKRQPVCKRPSLPASHKNRAKYNSPPPTFPDLVYNLSSLWCKRPYWKLIMKVGVEQKRDWNFVQESKFLFSSEDYQKYWLAGYNCLEESRKNILPLSLLL